ACFVQRDNPQLTVECDRNGLCTDIDHPVVFAAPPVAPIAVGSTLALGFAIHSTVAGKVSVVSDHPEILDVQIASGQILVTARGAGSATLPAVDGDDTRASLALRSEAALIEFVFRTPAAVPGPVSSLTALIGSTDSIGVTYRSVSGQALSGRGSLAIEGSA